MPTLCRISNRSQHTFGIHPPVAPSNCFLCPVDFSRSRNGPSEARTVADKTPNKRRELIQARSLWRYAFDSFRAARPSISRENPVIRRFTPTNVPMAQVELDGQ